MSVHWTKIEAPSILGVGSTCSSTTASVAQTTVSSTRYGQFFTITVYASSANTSNIYYDPSTVATTNSYPLHPGNETGPMMVKDTLSVISDTTTQRFYWKILDHA